MATCDDIHGRVASMRTRFSRRDSRMRDIRLVRGGRMKEVRNWDTFFADDLPDNIVANFIDIAARDISEVMGVLPALACSSGSGISQADRKRAQRKNWIGKYYRTLSHLDQEFIKFADNYITYGVGVLSVEPDFGKKTPRIRVEDPKGFYYLKNRWGELNECAKVWYQDRDELCALFPDYAHIIQGDMRQQWDHDNGRTMLEVVRYSHRNHGTTLYLPNRDNLVLAHFEPAVDGCLPYFIGERYTLEDIPNGQFDESLGIQAAKVLMSTYMFRAAERSINAPMVLPRDVGQYEEGPDAVMYSDNIREGHGIMPLNVPRDVFAFSDGLDKEVKESARYPDARSGQIKASIITGRGVEALLGTFDTQIKTGQLVFKKVLEDAFSYAFQMDAEMWPLVRKDISGVDSGQSYKFTYVPQRDIGEDCSCEVSYGFMLGNSPAQAMLMLLQLQSGGYISKHEVVAKLPFDVDADMTMRELDVERMDEALLSGLAAAAQAVLVQAQQGVPVDQSLIPLIKARKLREQGKPLHVAMEMAFTPPEPEPTEPALEEVPGGQPPGEQGMSNPALMASGLLRGVAPGQAGRNPGGLPDLMTQAAGLRGPQGTPQLSTNILTRRALAR